MSITKNAMITIAGRPNVGKSTLLNALIGEKIAIVTPKPQTTRHRIFGVVNRADAQLVFTDTPGFHKPRTKLGERMVSVVRESIADVDCVVLVVEPVATIGTQEQLLIERIAESRVPAILAINKIDTAARNAVLPVIAAYSAAHEFAAIVPISAKSGDGLPELLAELEKFAGAGPQLFPDGEVTDQPERAVVGEIVREKLLISLDREVPHGTAVEITKFSERGDEDAPIIDIDATIYCEKQSHKGIIIGKNGEMLKKIGSAARVDMERFMGAKVFLQLWVKVRENWRDSDGAIRNFGLGE
ncbi:MAG: GTPase Era [Oscillospiraceae bacterium]|jgi:GTP-binding protein Era|nr:GTPase Era [Oscillospiraceae bacterium]